MKRWILLHAPSAAKHRQEQFWRPSPRVLAGLVPGNEVQLRAVEYDDQDGAEFWDNEPLWVRVVKIAGHDCSGKVTISSIDAAGFRVKDRVSFTKDRIFDIAESAGKARFVRGKDIIVGLTYANRDGSVNHRVQFHGTILVAGVRRGIVIRRDDRDDLFMLPPDFRSIQPARPGTYRLQGTGQVIEDPTFESVWTITLPSGRR